jgi:hypothetical protein
LFAFDSFLLIPIFEFLLIYLAIYNLERKYGSSKVGRARYCAILELYESIIP